MLSACVMRCHCRVVATVPRALCGLTVAAPRHHRRTLCGLSVDTTSGEHLLPGMNEQLAAGNLASAVSVFRAGRESSLLPQKAQQQADSSAKEWAVLFNELISALLRTGGLDSEHVVHELLREMREVGPAPTGATYEILIAHFAEAGRQDEAVDTYSHMKGEGVRVSRTAYKWLLRHHAYYRNGRHAYAQNIFEEMASAGLPLDVDNYNLIIQMKLDGIKKEKQKKVMDKIDFGAVKGNSKQTSAFQTSTISHRRSLVMVETVLDDAEAVLDDMAAANVHPDVR